MLCGIKGCQIKKNLLFADYDFAGIGDKLGRELKKRV